MKTDQIKRYQATEQKKNKCHIPDLEKALSDLEFFYLRNGRLFECGCRSESFIHCQIYTYVLLVTNARTDSFLS